MVDRDDKKPLFSNAMMHFLRHRLMEILGLGLFFLSGLLLVALITADKNDPSFTNISDANVSNWLGPIGANISAALISVIGLAAFFLALVPFFWGLSYFRKQTVPLLGFRLLFLPISLVFLAGGLFALDGAGVSDIGGGGGAIIIEFVMRFMQNIPSVFGLQTIHYVGIASLFLGLVGWLWVAAISRQQWAHVTGQTTKLGLIFKGLFMIGQKVAGIFARVQKHCTPELTRKPKTLKQRQEPVFVAETGDQPARQVVSHSVSSRAERGKKSSAKQETMDFGSGSGFHIPPVRLLNPPVKAQSGPSKSVLEDHASQLEKVLSDFSVNGKIADVRYGPVVTRYDLNPAPGTKSQRVISLADDIARSMSAISVRVAVVPGQMLSELSCLM